MAFRASSTATANSSLISCAVPSGVAIGDIVVIAAAIDDDGATFTQAQFPSGFTLMGTSYNSLDGQTTSLGWKRLTAADTGTYAFGSAVVSGASEWICQAYAFSGRHATSAPAYVVTANNVANSSPVAFTAPTITAVAGDDLLWIGSADLDSGAVSTGFTPPSGYTERQDAKSTVGWDALSGASRDGVAAGATGAVTGTLTLSAGHAGWSAFLVRIPAAAGGAHVLAVGTVTTTEAPQPVRPRRSRGIATAAETSAAITVRAARRRGAGIAAEADAPLALGRRKRHGVGIAAEADAPLTVTRLHAAKVLAVGIAGTAEAPRPLTHVKRRAVGTVAETEGARPLARAGAGSGSGSPAADGAGRPGRIAHPASGRLGAHPRAGNVNHGTRGLVA